MISLNWVKDYIDIEDQNPHDLAVKITEAGVNVENIISNRIENLVVGEVVECVPHPDSDHLHVCKVDVGKKIIQIVCGAHNVRTGLKVLVALPGCVLPGNFEIKAGKIRGQESAGMICALYELGLEEKTDETYAKGIEELDTALPAGTDANIVLGTNDTVLELDVHKHRNNDCYYHIGFAYEIAAILGRKVKLPEICYKEIADSITNHVSIKVETEKCPFYLAKMVKGVKIAPSPDFIQKRLIAAGMRPINNVVDISNYVMLEFGQPLHFFDKAKVGSVMFVRQAFEGENIKTLDGQERILKSGDIVIADSEKPICIAGVMGGENTEVDEHTKDLVIESAIFDAVSIRLTAGRLNLKSEASIRYGKGLNFEYTKAAINRACQLLEKYAGATVLSGMITHDKLDKTQKIVTFSTDKVAKLLGLTLTDSDVERELERLDFAYSKSGKNFVVKVPHRRLDIDGNVNDIAEEIGRLYGYHNLASTLPKVPIRRGEYIGDVKLRKLATRRLRALGLNEVKTYTLVSEKEANTFNYDQKTQVRLPNPMVSDKSYIRSTILPSLLSAQQYNAARGVKDIMIYEIAKTYDFSYVEETKAAFLMTGTWLKNEWQGIEVKADFYTAKGAVENLLDYLGFKNRYAFVKAEIADFHPGICAYITVDREKVGVIGKVHPSLRKNDVFLAEISLTKLYNKTIKPIKFKEASRYPEIAKDLAFVVDKNTPSELIKSQIVRSGGRLLAGVKEFDVYQMEDKKSIAYALTFKDPTRTLFEDEVMSLVNKIIADVEAKTGAKLRS